MEALLYEWAGREVEKERLKEAGVTKFEAEGFYLLCATGSAAQVAEALKNGADARVPDKERGNTTALHDAAARNPDPDVIRLLLAAGADPNAQGNMYKRTPVHQAVLFSPNAGPVIRALAEGKPDFNIIDRVLETALQTAIDGRFDQQTGMSLGPHSESILALVESGADVNAEMDRSNTALAHYLSAIDRNRGPALDLRVVSAMIKAGANLNAPDVTSTGNTNDPLLHLAVKMDSAGGERRMALTLALLEGGADPLKKDERGKIALHQAAFYGNALVAKLLLTAAPQTDQANAADEDGERPLHILAQWQAEDMTSVGKILLDAGADINARDKGGRTPLHSLAENTDIRQVRQGTDADDIMRKAQKRADALAFLQKHKADLNATDNKGDTPLHTLCARTVLSHADIATFVKAGASINARDSLGRTPMMRFLITLQKDKNSYEWKEGLASLADDLSFLLEQGIDPGIFDKSGLRATDLLADGMKAVLKDTPVYTALQKGAAKRGETLLDLCAKGCDEATIRTAIGKGFDIDPRTLENGTTPLHEAAARGDIATIKAFIIVGADKDVADTLGATPLGVALDKGRYDAAETLLQAGSEINSQGYVMRFKDSEGTLLLSYLCAAVYERDDKMIDFILRQKPDLEGRSPIWISAPRIQGSALHLAVALENPAIVARLLQAGLDPNAQMSEDRTTPLHIAVHTKQKDVVRLLLDHKANPDITDRTGRSVRDMAKGGPLENLFP